MENGRSGGNGGNGARFIFRIFRSLPYAVRKAIFLGIALLFYHLVSQQRFIALQNLRLAFPEKSMEEIAAIARGVYRNLALVAAEFFDLPRLTPAWIERHVTVEGMDHFRRALEKGKGVLMFSAHFGNWELMAATAGLIIGPVMIVYRALDNTLLDTLVRQVRSATGNTMQAKDWALRPMLRTLKDNGLIGILIDQNVKRSEGDFVEFFGRPACTTNSLALMALRTGAPVIPAFLVRTGSRRYRFVIGAEVEIAKTPDRGGDLRENTQRFTRIIEDMVRRYPDHWLWIHQRWKTRPARLLRRRAVQAGNREREKNDTEGRDGENGWRDRQASLPGGER